MASHATQRWPIRQRTRKRTCGPRNTETVLLWSAGALGWRVCVCVCIAGKERWSVRVEKKTKNKIKPSEIKWKREQVYLTQSHAKWLYWSQIFIKTLLLNWNSGKGKWFLCKCSTLNKAFVSLIQKKSEKVVRSMSSVSLRMTWNLHTSTAEVWKFLNHPKSLFFLPLFPCYGLKITSSCYSPCNWND